MWTVPFHEGKPYFAEPGLIIVPEVTVQAMQEAVQFLWKQGFFASLKTEQDEELDATPTAPNKRLQVDRSPRAVPGEPEKTHLGCGG